MNAFEAAEKNGQGIFSFGGELGAVEPARRKFALAVGHVLTAEDTQVQHLGRCQFGAEFRIKVSSDGLDALVAIVSLHAIIHGDSFLFH